MESFKIRLAMDLQLDISDRVVLWILRDKLKAVQ